MFVVVEIPVISAEDNPEIVPMVSASTPPSPNTVVVEFTVLPMQVQLDKLDK